MKLATGAGFSQVILVAATPLLTRLYSPAQFGDFAVFTSIYTILAAVATLRFEQAIVVPAERAEAITLAHLALACAGVAGLLVGIAFFALDIAGAGERGHHLALAPMIVVGAASSIGLQWCLREREYGPIAKSAVLGSLVNVAVSIASYFAGVRESGLILGYCAGTVAAALYVWAPRTRLMGDVVAVRTRTEVFSRYRHFPRDVLPASLATTAGQYLFPIVITQLAGLHFAGLYAIANRVLALPTILVGNALQSIFHAEFNRRIASDEQPRRLFDRMLGGVALTAVPVFAVLAWVSPWLFEFVFGAAYAEAGVYARYLALGIAAMFIATPLLPTFIALKRTRAGLLLQLVASIAPLAVFALVNARAGFAAGLVGASLATAFSAALIVGVAQRMVRHSLAANPT